MGRSISPDHIAFGPETPCTADTFARAKRRVEPEPSLHEMKPVSTPGFRRTRSTLVKPSMTQSSTQQFQRSDFREMPLPVHNSRQHGHGTGAMSAQTTLRPYETPVFTPQDSQFDASEPYFGKTPMSPPDSTSSSSTTDKSPTKQPINAFPGTMAARNAQARTPARQRAGAKDRRKEEAQDHQWKSVFKGIFTRSPVDTARFERIKDRHWSDD